MVSLFHLLQRRSGVPEKKIYIYISETPRRDRKKEEVVVGCVKIESKASV